MRRLFSILLAMAAIFGANQRPIDIAAQPSDNELGETALFVILFPELRALPPPFWFVPGTRISYEAASAQVGGNVSGAGIIQYDVAAVDGLQGVALAQNYIDNGGGQLVPATPSWKVGLRGAGEFWINPTVLVRAEQVANPNLSITRKNVNVNGTQVPAVRFQSDLNGARTVWEFDAATGLLLFYSNSVPNPGTGTSTETQLRFLNLRQMQLPWAPDLAPNWVRPGVVMNYGGTQTVQIPNSPVIPQPYLLNTQLSRVAPTWSVNEAAIFLNGIAAGTTVGVSGVGLIFGGFWLPRSALQTPIPFNETVLDTDPVTGVQISYGLDGNGDILMRQKGQAFEKVLIYNGNLGSLDSFFQTIASPLSVTQTQLTRTGGDNLNSLNNLPDPRSSAVYLPAVGVD